MTRALSQQEAVRGHRLEAMLAELSQRRVLLLELQRRRQRLQACRHQSWHWDRCCKCVGRACQRRRWHCHLRLRREGVLAGKRKREELVSQPGRHSLWEQGPLGAGFYAR